MILCNEGLGCGGVVLKGALKCRHRQRIKSQILRLPVVPLPSPTPDNSYIASLHGNLHLKPYNTQDELSFHLYTVLRQHLLRDLRALILGKGNLPENSLQGTNFGISLSIRLKQSACRLVTICWSTS